MRNAVHETRSEIAEELKDHNYELVLLGIDNFDVDEYKLISEFLVDKMRAPDSSSQTALGIETIGEDHFDRDYSPHRRKRRHMVNIENYFTITQICGGILQVRLRAIARGALRPFGSNGKEIRLYDFNRNGVETKWPVSMVNSTYCPLVDVKDPKYSFKIRYPNKRICLLILSGKEYLAVTRYGELLREEREVMSILDEMRNNNEVLLILGAFNFEWTEIDIVTAIIHEHSGGSRRPAGNVFTCGYGMFDTAYLLNGNVNNGYPQEPNTNMTQLIKVLKGEKVNRKTINVFYNGEDGYIAWSTEVNMGNGQYHPEERFWAYRFPWVNRKVALIVYDPTEMNEHLDYLFINQLVDEVENSGICVALVEAVNFGLDDMHIIAELIDYHRGVSAQYPNGRNIPSERIAVLGAGTFETIFQSKSTTYRTLHSTKKNELIAIRDAYVNSGNGKRVFAAQIFRPRFEIWTYPMNTVNGHYESDLIPDKNMFDTADRKKILFIITSANRFYQISTMGNLAGAIQGLANGIEQHYPHSKWTVYLVGLDNFGPRHCHLFAELVEKQTHDGRFLDQFVRTVNYDIDFPVYQYKDTRPIPSHENPEIQALITSFFAASG